MAIAKPIRVLGLTAIGLWIFFLYQIFGPAKIPKGPGDTLENMDRDPNLDRMRVVLSTESKADHVF
jgi:mannosyltransferase